MPCTYIYIYVCICAYISICMYHIVSYIIHLKVSLETAVRTVASVPPLCAPGCTSCIGNVCIMFLFPAFVFPGNVPSSEGETDKINSATLSIYAAGRCEFIYAVTSAMVWPKTLND